MRLSLRAAPLVLALVLGLTACGGDDSTADATGPTTDGDSVAITVTREGDEFTPNGERVELGVDQTLKLTIDADQAGELHVHSTPEQEIAYDAGTSEHDLVIDRPGVVEVESHEPDVVLLQLEVR
jgi:hypothetical protein